MRASLREGGCGGLLGAVDGEVCVLQCVVGCYNILECVGACWSVLQCVAVCCSVCVWWIAGQC